MWMYQSKTHCQPPNFISLICVAFAFERSSCFIKIKQEITHCGCFNGKHETLYSWSVSPRSV